MSTRSLRARLDRLIRAKSAILQERDRARDFTINPALAEAIRDDYNRLGMLVRNRPRNAPESPEETTLRAHIAERAKAVSLPPEYGPREQFSDRDRLDAIHCKQMSPPQCGGGILSDAEDAEEAQLRARVEAFNETPEGRARNRIFELVLRSFVRISAAEKAELDRLKELYPELPLVPNDPRKRYYEALDRAIARWRTPRCE
jgi:hypothetical protein